jgi:hypothetical protein
VGRVIVQTAVETGQPVRVVAGDSFALTLWTWNLIQRQRREDAVERLGERTDMAGLMAVAFHDPAQLNKAELRYLAAAGRLKATLERTRTKMADLTAQIARAKPVEG